MENTLRAAAKRIEITPSEDDRRQGKVILRGYGEVTATKILDKIYARILVLEAGARRTAIVSLDCAFSHEVPFHAHPNGSIAPTIPPESRHQWAQALGSDDGSVFVCASHSHYTPNLHPDIANCIGSTIRELQKNSMVEVAVKLGVGTSPLCRYRRPKLLEPVDLKIKPVDLTVSTLLFERLEGGKPSSPLACLVSYGVHPTLYGDPAKLTSEFVGLAMQGLEGKSEEPEPVALFVQGFSGDLSPVFPTRLTRDDYQTITEFGGYLKGDIEKTLAAAKPVPVASLVTAEKIIKSPPLRPNHQHRPAITINGLRLGQVVLLSCSAEVFFEIGPKVRDLAKARGFEHTILGGLVNGYSGYLPTRAAFHDNLKGYELEVSPYADTVEGVFLEGVEEVLNRLAGGA